MNGYMQLVDGTVLALVRSAALMEEEEGIVHEDGNGKGEGKMIKGRRKGDEDSERGKDDEQDNLLQHASAPSSSSSTLSHLGPAQRASALLARIEKRELYKFVGGALLSSGMESAIDVNGPNGAGRAAADLNQVRDKTQQWIYEYNHIRPHESLNNQPPVRFLQERGKITLPFLNIDDHLKEKTIITNAPV